MRTTQRRPSTLWACRKKPWALGWQWRVCWGRILAYELGSRIWQGPLAQHPCYAVKDPGRSKTPGWGTSLVVLWSRLLTLTAKGLDSISGWGTKLPKAAWCDQKKLNTNSRVRNHLDTEPRLCASHCQDWFFKPHNNPRRWAFLASLFYRRNWGMEKWSNLSKVTKTAGGRKRFDPC